MSEYDYESASMQLQLGVIFFVAPPKYSEGALGRSPGVLWGSGHLGRLGSNAVIHFTNRRMGTRGRPPLGWEISHSV